jgi:hypothetical protein
MKLPWMRFSPRKSDAVQLDLHADRDHADDVGRAAAAQHLERLLGGGLQADGLEAVVDAAAGQLLHLP